MDTIPPSLYNRFYRYGTGCRIALGGVLSLPEQTAIGAGVLVREGYRWEIPSPDKNGSPRIVIGDRCECSRFLTIHATGKVELKADVMTGPHVFITDVMQAWERDDRGPARVTIGESSWIGAHSSILGHVKIGKGCVVGAGSVVLQDVPDYCVVAGNPAEFRRIYEPASGEWIRVHSEAEAREVLARRRVEPLLSICLPVHNQTEALRSCLESIYAQTDDAGLIEVCIYDDASTEETGEIASYYENLYRSLRYFRNPAPVVHSLLNVQAADMARGKFIMLHDPGRPLLHDSLVPFLNVLHTHPDCSIILTQRSPLRRTSQPERYEGLSEYVRHTAARSVSPLPLVLNRLGWEEAAYSVQAQDDLDPWVSRQYAMLQSNPHFCLCRYTLTEAVEHIRTGE
ncbi:glycosyltransferase [Paenibacillus sp. FSL K6-1217]|uniref:glycosyltransferase n=1 Tax=Paenibacillus sp. FSL K6-1217 TaxID=2921466 RepID=UPI003251BE56